jgi:hypothetical protein
VFVVAPALDRAAILAGLRQHLDSVFLPRHIVFVDACRVTAMARFWPVPCRR